MHCAVIPSCSLESQCWNRSVWRAARTPGLDQSSCAVEQSWCHKGAMAATASSLTLPAFLSFKVQHAACSITEPGVLLSPTTPKHGQQSARTPQSCQFLGHLTGAPVISYGLVDLSRPAYGHPIHRLRCSSSAASKVVGYRVTLRLPGLRDA